MCDVASSVYAAKKSVRVEIRWKTVTQIENGAIITHLASSSSEKWKLNSVYMDGVF